MGLDHFDHVCAYSGKVVDKSFVKSEIIDRKFSGAEGRALSIILLSETILSRFKLTIVFANYHIARYVI
jgi:hypothetical protein